jgi:hypothetical protein
MFKIGDKLKIEVVVNDLCDSGVTLTTSSGYQWWISEEDLKCEVEIADKEFVKKSIERQIKELQDKLEKL